MKRKIRLSFLEREFHVGDRTGKHVRGYEQTLAVIDGKPTVCRSINLERLRQVEYQDTALFVTEFDYSELDLDLAEVLQEDESSRSWLEAFRTLYREDFEKLPMTKFSLKPMDSEVPLLLLTFYDDDKVEEMDQRPPKALIARLPEHAVYAKLCPPERFEDGERIPNVHYRRMVLLAEGQLGGISLRDFPTVLHQPESREAMLQVEGALLGQVTEWDLDCVSWELGGREFKTMETPMQTFLHVGYPISIRDNKKNPLSIKVELKEEVKL